MISRPTLATPIDSYSSIDKKTKNKVIRYTFNARQFDYLLRGELWKDEQRIVEFHNEKELLRIKEKQLWKNYLSQYGVMLRRVFWLLLMSSVQE